MVALRSRVTFGAAVSLAVAVTIFAFASGTSSVQAVSDVAKTGRWLALAGLLAIALAYAAPRWDRARALPAAAWVLAWLLGLACLSVFWSVAPWLTLGRSLSLAVTLTAAVALAYGAWGRPLEVRRILLGILAGATAVALAGLVVFAVSRSTAMQGSTSLLRSRFRGFGLTPNTASMLYALALPLAVLAVVEARTRSGRAAALASFALVDLSLIASGSRGSQIGGFLGLVALAFALGGAARLRVGAVVVGSAALALGVGAAQTAPATDDPAAPVDTRTPTLVVPSPGALDQELRGDLAGASRSLFGSSGRIEAWKGGARQGNERPLLGHGFGTEERVFVDRYYAFRGDNASNSWIGLYLQLGLGGVALFAALWTALAAAAVRILRRRTDRVGAACAAVVVAALPLTLAESWVYSVGNIATVTFWISALLLATAAARRLPVFVDAPTAVGEQAPEELVASLARW